LTQPVLDAGDFVLRPWQSADAPALVAGYGDPGIRQWHTRSMTTGEALAWIEAWPNRWQEETSCGWAAADDHKVLGQITFRTIDLQEGTAELSYWVLPEARGRGVARQAVVSLTTWSFDVLGLHRLEINHSTANPASCRVAERAGYMGEGVKRSSALHLDGWHDMHQHARIATDPA
jgi:[ribosomal protein S5]-alanine N-acetyltransferase